MATSGSDYASLRKRLDALIADAQARRAAEEQGSTGQTPSSEPITLAAPPTVSPYRRILPEATATSEEFAPGTVEPFGATLGHAVGLDEPEDVLPWAAKQLGMYYGGGLALKGVGAGLRSLRGLMAARQAAQEAPSAAAQAVKLAQEFQEAGRSHTVASRMAGTPGQGQATATAISHAPQRVDAASLRGLEEAGHQARISRASRPAPSLAQSGQNYLDLLGHVYRRSKLLYDPTHPERRMAGRALAESGKASTGLDIMKNLYRKNPVRLLTP